MRFSGGKGPRKLWRSESQSESKGSYCYVMESSSPRLKVRPLKCIYMGNF